MKSDDLQPALDFLDNGLPRFIFLALAFKILDFDFVSISVNCLLESDEELQIPYSKLLMQFLQVKVRS